MKVNSMARARNIKPGFFLNPEIGELPPETRLLFIGLWCLADREGRLLNRAMRIRAEIFPYEPHLDVAKMLCELENAGFIQQYVADGKICVQVINFVKHQSPHHKEVESELPAPEGASNSVCHGYVPLNNSLRALVRQRDPLHCNYCKSSDDLQVDHIIPVTRGGNSVAENLQILCRGCNIRKSNKIVSHEESIRQGRVVLESSMNHDCSNNSALCPTDTGYRIPDSGYLKPDVLIADDAKDVASAPKPTKASTRANPSTGIAILLTDLASIPTELAERAEKLGTKASDIPDEWAKFRNHHISARSKHTRIDLCWDTWCRNASKWQRRSPANAGGASGQGGNPRYDHVAAATDKALAELYGVRREGYGRPSNELSADACPFGDGQEAIDAMFVDAEPSPATSQEPARGFGGGDPDRAGGSALPLEVQRG